MRFKSEKSSSRLAIFPRRAILRVAMLLRDSEIAKSFDWRERFKAGLAKMMEDFKNLAELLEESEPRFPKGASFSLSSKREPAYTQSRRKTTRSLFPTPSLGYPELCSEKKDRPL